MRLFDSAAEQEGTMRCVNGLLAQQTALTCHSGGKKTGGLNNSNIRLSVQAVPASHTHVSRNSGKWGL